MEYQVRSLEFDLQSMHKTVAIKNINTMGSGLYQVNEKEISPPLNETLSMCLCLPLRGYNECPLCDR